MFFVNTFYFFMHIGTISLCFVANAVIFIAEGSGKIVKIVKSRKRLDSKVQVFYVEYAEGVMSGDVQSNMAKTL